MDTIYSSFSNQQARVAAVAARAERWNMPSFRMSSLDVREASELSPCPERTALQLCLRDDRRNDVLVQQPGVRFESLKE